MTDAPWYRLSDLPTGRVRVRVMWAGRSFIAARSIVPGSTAWGWFVTIPGTGEIEQVPPKALARSWGPEPDAWQPLDLVAFWGKRTPPAPMRSTVSRMVSETVRFQAVEEATVSELAREMEADRETARVSRETAEVSHAHLQPFQQWWFDPYAIRYEPAGQVSKRMAEGRIMRALAHADVGKGLTLVSRTIQDVLAGLAEAADMALSGAVEDPLARFEPQPQDHADFLTAMGWFAALNPPDRRHKHGKAWGLTMHQKVLAWTARPIPLSSGDMAALVGRSDARMRQVRDEAFEMVVRVANGLPARASWPVVDQMAALKQRNTAARRSA